LLIAATNHEGLLDRALWRRFDGVLLFDRPQVPRDLPRLRLSTSEAGTE
jgi:SpoVK/Ycf46/Vps4 family AAA+-type ATPase